MEDVKFEEGELPEGVTAQQMNEWLEKHGEVRTGEIEKLGEEGTMLPFIFRKPTMTDFGAAMRFINPDPQKNQPLKVQLTLGQSCVLWSHPDMKEELVREQYAIGTGKAVGEAYPIPEAKLKKVWTRK